VLHRNETNYLFSLRYGRYPRVSKDLFTMKHISGGLRLRATTCQGMPVYDQSRARPAQFMISPVPKDGCRGFNHKRAQPPQAAAIRGTIIPASAATITSESYLACPYRAR
jgi:hypothetical protein